MARRTLLMSVLLTSIQPSFAAEPEASLAGDLIGEARKLSDASCGSLAELGTALAKSGDVEASKKSFADAWRAAVKIEDGVERRIALHSIATLQASVGQFQEAVESSQRLGSRSEQAMTLGAIAVAQAEAGEETAALRTVDLLSSEKTWERVSTLQLVAMSLSARGEFAGAIRVLDRIPANAELAEKILDKSVLPEELDPNEETVVEHAMIRSAGFVAIADDQARAGDFQSALKTALGIRLDQLRDVGLRVVACVAADSGNLAVAHESLEGILGQSQRELASVRVVAGLSKQGRFKEALDLTGTINDPSNKADAFFDMAAAQAARGNGKAARRIFEEAKSLTPSDNDVHDLAAKQIVEAALQAPHLEFAEAFSLEIDDPGTLAEAFRAIAIANWRTKKTSDARRLFDKSRHSAEEVADPYNRCVHLRRLATAQSDAGDREGAKTLVELAVAAAQKIEIGGGTDVIALTETAAIQRMIRDQSGATTTFKIARTTAFRYLNEPYVSQLLQDVAFAQASVGDVEAAIQSARRQTSPHIRARMLLGVANALLSQRDGQ